MSKGFGTTGFTFGASQPGGLGGAPATSVPTAMTFGTPLTSFPAGGGNYTPGFSQQITTATNTTSAPPPLSFTAAPQTQSFSFGAGQPATTAATASFGFGGTTTTSALGAGNLSFSAAPTAAPVSGLFGAKTTAPTLTGPNASIIGTAPNPLSQPAKPIGLGGVDMNATQPKANEGKVEGKTTKEDKVPQEIASTVESLKQHIKQQKTLSADIGRSASHKLISISGEIEKLNFTLQDIANSVETNYTTIKALRVDTSKAIQLAEMAQRTHDTPAGLQYENVAPLQYFAELVQTYEMDLINFRKQVEATEQHMVSLANPQTYSPEDLKKCLIQMHETFIALAGRLHETHQKVENLKEEYLNMRRLVLRDKTDVFEEAEKKDDDYCFKSRISSGPTPFSGLSSFPSHTFTNNQSTANKTFGIGASSFNAPGNGTHYFGDSTATNQTMSTFGSPFALQKPPFGGKRNKQ